MVNKNTFTTEAGLFCKTCGKPAKYYSFRGNINAYNCQYPPCDNESVVEDNMTTADINKCGFELKKVVVYW